MSASEEHYSTGSRASDNTLIAFFMLMLLACLLVLIMLAVRKVDRRLKPDLAKVPEYAAVQHDAPPPYPEIEEPGHGLGVVVVDVDDNYKGDVIVGWS